MATVQLLKIVDCSKANECLNHVCGTTNKLREAYKMKTGVLSGIDACTEPMK